MRSRPGNRSRAMGGYADTWVAKRGVTGQADPGICTSCGAHLSVYRSAEETTCAPCGSKVILRRHPR